MQKIESGNILGWKIDVKNSSQKIKKIVLMDKTLNGSKKFES